MRPGDCFVDSVAENLLDRLEVGTAWSGFHFLWQFDLGKEKDTREREFVLQLAFSLVFSITLLMLRM